MDKGLAVPKWVLTVCPKIPQIPQNLSAQFVCPSPKILDLNEKRLHWAYTVRGLHQFKGKFHFILVLMPTHQTIFQLK